MSVLLKLDEIKAKLEDIHANTAYALERFEELSAENKKILAMLSKESQQTVKKEIKSEHVSGVDLEKEEPKETNVQETIQGIVRLVTEKAVQIVAGIRSVWIPKSAIKNLSSVVLEQGKPVSVDIHTWFVPKVEWKVI